MIELFEIYRYAFILCLFASLVLSWSGTHLVNRGQSFELISITGLVLLGNLIGRLLFHDNFLFSLLATLFIYMVFKFKILKSYILKENDFLVLYFGFLSIAYVLVSWFPRLENRLNIGIFGDIVSISNNESIGLIGIYIISLFILIKFSRFFIRSTFDKKIFNKKKLYLPEELLFLFILTISIYFLGQLFTISYLIFPITLIGSSFKNYSSSLKGMAIASTLSATFGLTFSIISSRLPTVPSQTLILVIFLFITKFLLRKRKIHGQDNRSIKNS